MLSSFALSPRRLKVKSVMYWTDSGCRSGFPDRDQATAQPFNAVQNTAVVRVKLLSQRGCVPNYKKQYEGFRCMISAEINPALSCDWLNL